MTQNLWGIRGAWELRRNVLARGLEEEQPDLVSFQEAIKNRDHDTVADLLGSGYKIAYQQHPEPDGQSGAIASRWPIESVTEVDLHVTPRTSGVACTTMVAEINAPEPFGRVLFVNHLPNWQLDFQFERERQAAKAAAFVESVIPGRQLHVILAGDLTDPPEAGSVRLWTGRQSVEGVSVCYRDAWESAHPNDPGETYTARNPILADWDWPFQRLDYVMVRCGAHGGPTLAIASCRRLFDEAVDGIWASDHFGVMAELTIPQRPPPPAPNRTA